MQEDGTKLNVPQGAVAQMIGSLQLENLALRRRIDELEQELSERPKEQVPAQTS